jgi:YesN/AraC family two-component response regulator
METNADDYVTKPFNNKLLKAKVKSIIQNRLLIQQKLKKQIDMDMPEMATSLSATDLKFLQKAKDVVEKNLENTEFLSPDFAIQMGIGRTKLYNKIKGITGMTLNDFILSVRLGKAQEMLLDANNEKNISEIAYSAGFSTAGYFTKCFRKQFGVAPSIYIDNLKKN